MGPETVSLIGAVILALDVFAIISVLLGSSGAIRKLLWIVVILLMPVVGMVLYFLFGRTSQDVRV